MNTVKSQRKKTRAGYRAGFTLIEMCFVMLISGLFSLSFLKYYSDYSERQRVVTTEDALELAEGAIREFFSEEGRYPCPAPPGVNTTHAQYGLEDCAANFADTEIVTGRDTDLDGTDDDIIIGSIPVRFLIQHYIDNNLVMDVPITESAVLDGWGQKLTYAVTRSQTVDRATFDQRRGAIKIVDEHDQDITPVPGNAHFVVVSHGRNGVGGFSRSGTRTENCTPIIIPTGLPASTVITPVNERDNCDYNDDKFVSALRNDSQYSSYDDYVRFFAFSQTDLWRVAATIDYKAYNTNTGNVGIMEQLPMQRLDVAGNIQADQIIAQRVCDRGGVDCMDIELLAGEDARMNCDDTDQAFRQIHFNEAECADYKIPTPPATACGVGQVMTGVRANGTLICAARPPGP